MTDADVSALHGALAFAEVIPFRTLDGGTAVFSPIERNQTE